LLRVRCFWNVLLWSGLFCSVDNNTAGGLFGVLQVQKDDDSAAAFAAKKQVKKVRITPPPPPPPAPIVVKVEKKGKPVAPIPKPSMKKDTRPTILIPAKKTGSQKSPASMSRTTTNSQRNRAASPYKSLCDFVTKSGIPVDLYGIEFAELEIDGSIVPLDPPVV
jgi:hypothetical protein